MKRFYIILCLIGIVTSFVTCTDDKELVEPSLDVTYNNMKGIWMLTEWNGNPLAKGSFVYIEFIRKPNDDNNRTYNMYDNMDSFSPKYRSGIYAIRNDENEPWPILVGQYDHSGGDWNHDYFVTELKRDKMILAVKGDEGDISVYTRVEKIPDEIGENSGTDIDDPSTEIDD